MIHQRLISICYYTYTHHTCGSWPTYIESVEEQKRTIAAYQMEVETLNIVTLHVHVKQITAGPLLRTSEESASPV